MSTPGEALRCPVCQAPFRGTGDCSRCGADLRCLMRLALSAHAARQAARQAILAGDARTAAIFARRAERCRSTPAGERLLALSRRGQDPDGLGATEAHARQGHRPRAEPVA